MMELDERFNRIQDNRFVILVESNEVYEVKDIIRIGQYILVDIGSNELVQDVDVMTINEAGETYRLINYIKTKLL
jgi:hypothetical protein